MKKLLENRNIEYVKTDFKKKEYMKEYKKKDYEYKKPAERKTCGKCGNSLNYLKIHEFRNCLTYKSKCHKCNKEEHWKSYVKNQVNGNIHILMQITKLTV